MNKSNGFTWIANMKTYRFFFVIFVMFFSSLSSISLSLSNESKPNMRNCRITYIRWNMKFMAKKEKQNKYKTTGKATCNKLHFITCLRILVSERELEKCHIDDDNDGIYRIQCSHSTWNERREKKATTHTLHNSWNIFLPNAHQKHCLKLRQRPCEINSLTCPFIVRTRTRSLTKCKRMLDTQLIRFVCKFNKWKKKN